MIVSELLESIFENINTEINKIMEDPIREKLIEDIIPDDSIDINNYIVIAPNYIEVINKLLLDSQEVKYFLKNLLLILKKLENIDIEALPIDVEFKLIDIPKDLLNGLYIENAEIENLYLFENNLAIISTSHIHFENYLEKLDNETDKVEKMLYLSKAMIDNFEYTKNNDNNRIILLSDCSNDELTNYKQNTTELVSFLKLCILSEGKSFHKHFNLEQTIPIASRPQCDITKEYSQYNEIFFILSEYNKSSDLLNKFFLLYTIIENFMYRYPIATMLENSEEFSIRNFKAFYSKIDSNEIQKLKELFKEIMEVEYDDGIKVYDDIKSILDSFEVNNDNNLTQLSEFFKKLRINNKAHNMNKGILMQSLKDKYFAEIIYQLRNSILHNTATEFHITHYVLSQNNIIVLLLQDFIIPILEKIILQLIFTNNPLIHYKSNAMTLYRK